MIADFKKTIRSCFIGYVVQAIINNFVPMLFLTFQSTYGIPLSQITILIAVNFILQLATDLASVAFIDKIGYRASMIIAHLFSATGLALLTVLPELLPNAFSGLLIAVIIYAVGGGLLEVLVSPIVEACPTDNKETAMSMLHSAYCWGQAGVILFSTIFFAVFGLGKWKIMAIIWAVIPVLNGITFFKVPINSLNDVNEHSASVGSMFKSKLFWVFMLMMLCAGASELAVSQWASTFAEQGLGVNKSVGDLAGPMAFAVLMGLSRTFYGKFGEKINLERLMLFSSVLCVAAYICIGLSGNPAVSLAACAICGLSVGIMWPGSFSKAAASLKGGSTAMFAMLALAGDLGCSAGPSLVGRVATATGGDLKKGILAGAVFPFLLIIGMFLYKKLQKKNSSLR